MNILFIAILLVGFALILLGVDLFLPTGGILMVLSALCALAGLGFGFAHSATAGGWLTLIVLIAIPVSLGIFVKFYPSTPIGRKMIMDRPQAIPYDFQNGPVKHLLSVGDVGIAKSTLQPSGKISINGVDFEAVCVTGIIAEGNAVIVTDIEMNVATVERYDADVSNSSLVNPDSSRSLEHEKNSESSLLNLSPEKFNLNDLDSSKES